jgi:hypothetical protein
MSMTKNMVMVFPNSSSVAGLLYNSGKLWVEFRGTKNELGNVYSYSEVPENIFLDFVVARSPGRYFRTFVRGQYATKRLW